MPRSLFQRKEKKMSGEMAVLGSDRGVLFTNDKERILFPQGVPVDETKAREIENILKNSKVLVRYIRKNRKKIPVATTDNQGTARIDYLKNKGTPIGALVAFLTKEGHIRFGWSRRHSAKEPIPFTKIVAKRVALCRALDEVVFKTKDGVMVMADVRPLPNRIAKQIPSFLERAMKYFKKEGVLNFAETDKVFAEEGKTMEAGSGYA
jgi:hypothetical protein